MNKAQVSRCESGDLGLGFVSHEVHQFASGPANGRGEGVVGLPCLGPVPTRWRCRTGSRNSISYVPWGSGVQVVLDRVVKARAALTSGRDLGLGSVPDVGNEQVVKAAGSGRISRCRLLERSPR